MNTQETIDSLRTVINQHSKTIKEMADVVNTLSRRVRELETLTSPQREKSDIFTKAVMDELFKRKK